MKSLKYAVIAALVASTVTLQPVSALAQGRDRRDRYEDRDRDRDDLRAAGLRLENTELVVLITGSEEAGLRGASSVSASLPMDASSAAWLREVLA